ncbi:putative glutamine amidotransferase YLR126C [Carex littledalei]|uniref:Putative glutamine amidotransferase YLR126C n=1 Tax=Carex littledalei TaxID=544730 RepID=A0A833RTD3_9POAL|nr:putative glutamine amidotransferase YLR126C [Carex littledalei]
MKGENVKRYALLLAAKDSDYVIKMYNGYFNVFVQAFGDEDENWDLFRVVEGEFPKIEELNKYDGFVISGSPHDAYANDLWILRLCFLIQKLHAMQKRVLGICFGHQVLCQALGGRVGKARSGWDVGVRRVIMAESLLQCRFLDEFKEIPPCAKILKCHQDEVLEVPPGAEVLAFSDKAGVEMFCIGDHIFGIQGHPEYTKDILLNLIDRLTSNELLDIDFGSDAKTQLEADDAERDFWEKLCKTFLKRNVEI